MGATQDLMGLATPDPEWEQAVKDTMGGQAPDLGVFSDIASLRKWISDAKRAMSAHMGFKIEGVKEQDHQVPMRDGSTITCRVYSPEKPPSNGGPLVVIFHGGGRCIDLRQNTSFQLRCTIVTTPRNGPQPVLLPLAQTQANDTAVFFDWALQMGFVDITLSPTKFAKVPESGSNRLYG
ncbi:hypothetical protein RBB50_012825 [Rhinocladiella similis]